MSYNPPINGLTPIRNGGLLTSPLYVLFHPIYNL